MYLKFCLSEIEKIIEKYKLKLNKKTRIYKSTEGIEFLGFRFIINKKIIIKVKNNTKRKFKSKVKEMCNESVLNSYIGHLSHGNYNGLIYNVFKKIKYSRQTKKSLL